MPPAGIPAATGAHRIGDTGGREAGQGHRSLLGIGGGQHDADPVAQVVQVQPTRGVVLAQQHDQALTVGVPEQRAPPGWGTAPRLAHADGVTTTALP